jgi:hypothetical protein
VGNWKRITKRLVVVLVLLDKRPHEKSWGFLFSTEDVVRRDGSSGILFRTDSCDTNFWMGRQVDHELLCAKQYKIMITGKKLL